MSCSGASRASGSATVDGSTCRAAAAGIEVSAAVLNALRSGGGRRPAAAEVWGAARRGSCVRCGGARLVHAALCGAFGEDGKRFLHLDLTAMDWSNENDCLRLAQKPGSEAANCAHRLSCGA